MSFMAGVTLCLLVAVGIAGLVLRSRRRPIAIDVDAERGLLVFTRDVRVAKWLGVASAIAGGIMTTLMSVQLWAEVDASASAVRNGLAGTALAAVGIAGFGTAFVVSRAEASGVGLVVGRDEISYVDGAVRQSLAWDDVESIDEVTMRTGPCVQVRPVRDSAIVVESLRAALERYVRRPEYSRRINILPMTVGLDPQTCRELLDFYRENRSAREELGADAALTRFAQNEFG